MSLDISDGFNFAIGQYIGDLAITLIVGGICLTICGVILLGIHIYEYIQNRRFRK